ncbi:hypothetical protein BKA67DRAFT_311892 [Truncatella angustata]|uniref:Uncharacterized protein n=1 Tax=Truncatella angustata TaxID=152316 RepID=A0A9P8ZW36_9PEZI|nr:uncharacterized protein BKA67DRAFT_311892 [Truncatella angustata]KAH6653220.1 hypothetical protein BKA67DRAFT_311892 [Truncatella angustata]
MLQIGLLITLCRGLIHSRYHESACLATAKPQNSTSALKGSARAAPLTIVRRWIHLSSPGVTDPRLGRDHQVEFVGWRSTDLAAGTIQQLCKSSAHDGRTFLIQHALYSGFTHAEAVPGACSCRSCRLCGAVRIDRDHC